MYKLFKTLSPFHFRVYRGHSLFMCVKFKAVSTRERGEILQRNCVFPCEIGFQIICFKHACTLGQFFFSIFRTEEEVNVKHHWTMTLFYTGPFQLLTNN